MMASFEVDDVGASPNLLQPAGSRPEYPEPAGGTSPDADRRARKAAYRAAHRQEIRAYNAAYRAAHGDERRAEKRALKAQQAEERAAAKAQRAEERARSAAERERIAAEKRIAAEERAVKAQQAERRRERKRQLRAMLPPRLADTTLLRAEIARDQEIERRYRPVLDLDLPVELRPVPHPVPVVRRIG